MSDQTVNTDEFSTLVRELLDAHGLDYKTAAQPIGPVSAYPDTIRRWRDGPHGPGDRKKGVSPATVRDFARALRYPVRDALVRVGFLTAEEAGLSLTPTRPAGGMHRFALQLDRLLRNSRLPKQHIEYLEWLVEGLIKFFLAQIRLPPGPKEASARERAAGAPSVVEPRQRQRKA